MKRFLFAMMFLASGLLCAGQDAEALGKIGGFTLYAVDFSQTEVFAADETADEFINAFEGINILLLRERDKYVGTLEKKLGKTAIKTNLTSVIGALGSIDRSSLVTLSGVSRLSQEQIEAAVERLDTGDDRGTGLLVVADYLDKSRAVGAYTFVFFDIATRQIITSWKQDGNAMGFGLRNYWAGSLHYAIRHIRISGK